LPSAFPWLIVAIIGAALALISFFLPLAGVTLTIPESFFSNSMEIKVSFSAWQLLSNSAPNVEGADWLGEMSQDLYEEYDMTNMVADSFGDSAVSMIKIARFIVFLLGVLALAVTGLSVWAYSKKQTTHTGFSIGMGIAAILLLLTMTIALGSSIETGSAEGNALVNALVKFWNGFGFWGMLFGFAAFSFANFKQR
jgi:cytochrome b subunit of formate dehydrogenase